MNGREIRSFKLDEVRVAKGQNDNPRIVGHAAVFDSWTTIGDFQEVIRKGAFKRAIAEKQDVRALVNHNESLVIGRSTNGTLRMVEDDRGLLVEIDPPDTQTARDAVKLIEGGYMNAMSFAFAVHGGKAQKWNDDFSKRELLDLDLYDVSVVTYPAYEATSVAIRSAGPAIESRKRARRLRAMEACLTAFEAKHGK